MKHTSGPWHVAPLSPTWVGTKYGEQVASTDTFDIEDKEEQEANALLIAAAPELLAAARNLLDAVTTQCDYGEGSVTDKWVIDARAAISKATGGEQ